MPRLADTPSVAVGILRPRRKLATTQDQDWRAASLCRTAVPIAAPWGPVLVKIPADLWHPDQGDSRSAATARRICRSCPVQADCLAYALVHNEPLGIWGGTTERQRRDIKRALLAHRGEQLDEAV